MIKELEKYNFLFWIITILLAGVIFYFSSFAFSKTLGDGGGSVTNWKSIVYHITIFFALALFFFISFIRGRWNSKLFIFSILVLIAYGILDEIHQFFVPGRYSSFVDVGFNSLGILLAFMFYLIILELE
jgi:hypothetical protein